MICLEVQNVPQEKKKDETTKGTKNKLLIHEVKLSLVPTVVYFRPCIDPTHLIPFAPPLPFIA